MPPGVVFRVMVIFVPPGGEWPLLCPLGGGEKWPLLLYQLIHSSDVLQLQQLHSVCVWWACPLQVRFLTLSLLSAGVDISTTTTSSSSSGTPCYSGLYAYHCLDKQWVCLRQDFTEGGYPDPLVPRMAHSMVLDNVSSCDIFSPPSECTLSTFSLFTGGAEAVHHWWSEEASVEVSVH